MRCLDSKIEIYADVQILEFKRVKIILKKDSHVQQ